MDRLFDFFTFFCKKMSSGNSFRLLFKLKELALGVNVVHDIFLHLVIDSKVIESISDVDNVA